MEMADTEIDAVVDGFAAAAALAAAADLDGVEINAGQHSLLRQFQSGLTNQRGDDYGQDRLLLTERLLRAARGAVGAGRVLGLRLCCDEFAPWAGVTPELAAEQAARLAGLADYLVVVRGSIYSVPATRPDLHTAPGFGANCAAQVRAAVDGAVPVVLQGSVVDPGQAQWALDDGVADLVEMTRAQIADPDLVARCASGRSRTESAPACCATRRAWSGITGTRSSAASSSPRSGHELTTPTPTPAPRPRTSRRQPVLVVGGGPAGMECARVLAAARQPGAPGGARAGAGRHAGHGGAGPRAAAAGRCRGLVAAGMRRLDVAVELRPRGHRGRGRRRAGRGAARGAGHRFGARPARVPRHAGRACGGGRRPGAW